MKIIGLDIGIGSCGWAVVQMPEMDPSTGKLVGPCNILGCGARCFEIPEDPKTRELKNKTRRQARGMRRTVWRRAWRLKQVRAALSAAGLPPHPEPLAKANADDKKRKAELVWHLRAEGLDRRLDVDEFASVLIHIAKHRGFKSNSKRDLTPNRPEQGKILTAIARTEERSAQWRTLGEMLARDPAYAGRKRNRPDDYSMTLPRAALEAEVRTLFARQRQLANTLATEELERQYAKHAFRQESLQDSDGLVAYCRFEPDEKRAPRNAPSFERFRFLSRLNHQKLFAPGEPARVLTADERLRAQALFARQKEVTFATLRRALGLDENIRFEGVVRDKERSTSFARFAGSALFRELLGEVRFRALVEKSAERLDLAARALIFFDNPDRIQGELAESQLGHDDIEKLTSSHALGRFAQLSGAGHISAKACRSLMPHLEAGAVYSEACRLAGYDHSAIGLSTLADIRNPTVNKVLRECLKQVEVVDQTLRRARSRSSGNGPRHRQIPGGSQGHRDRANGAGQPTARRG